MSSPDVVTLATIGDGAAGELFQAELDRILKNIADPNTDPKAKREITLKVTVAPDESREMAAVLIKCTSKLAGLKGHQTAVFFGRSAGQLVAVESNPKQKGLFDEGTGIQPVAINGGKA
jgi:hypothetical protein